MTGATQELRRRLDASARRAEAQAAALGLSLAIAFLCEGAPACRVIARGGSVACEDGGAGADITIAASEAAWRTALAAVPPPGFSSFTAWQLRNPEFAVIGDALRIAQARALLEVLVEGLWPGVDEQAEPLTMDLTAITGRYRRVRAPYGDSADVYVESVGAGPPLVCLHTAGADGRQFHPLMSDPDVASQWHVLAFDMPSHGRTLPSSRWRGERHRLTQQQYLDWCTAFIEQVIGEPVTLLGGSMGAAMTLVLAAERPALVRGVVALEPPVRPRGRRNEFLTHAAVHGGLHSAAYVRGLMGPKAPLRQRRVAAWIYAQGAPGVYDGDLMFYSDEFDGEAVAQRIDGARIPVQLLIGHYDFSATVADARALAGWIPGAEVIEMPDLGHFPMIEHPAAVRPYLLRALKAVRGAALTESQSTG